MVWLVEVERGERVRRELERGDGALLCRGCYWGRRKRGEGRGWFIARVWDDGGGLIYIKPPGEADLGYSIVRVHVNPCCTSS